MDKLGTILVVDDHEDTCIVIASMLSEEGFSVETFTSGVAARDHIQHATNGRAVGLIILDLIMPGMNGNALNDWVKQYAPHIGVIFITAQKPAPQIPGHRVLSKPITDTKEFVAIVWAALKSASTTAAFSRIESKVDKLVECQAVSQAKIDEAISTMASSIQIIGSTATEARSKAEAAHDVASKARSDLDDTTLTKTIQTEWSKVSPGAKMVFKAASSTMGVVFSLLAMVGTYFASGIKDRVQALLSIQTEVKDRINPALQRIDARLEDISKKQGGKVP